MPETEKPIPKLRDRAMPERQAIRAVIDDEKARLKEASKRAEKANEAEHG